MEPSWLKIEKNLVWVWSGCGLQNLLKIDVLKKMVSWSAPDSILEPPGLDFGGSGPRFWPILKNSGIDFSAKSWLESVSYQQVRISWFRPKFMTVFHLACQQHEDKL